MSTFLDSMTLQQCQKCIIALQGGDEYDVTEQVQGLEQRLTICESRSSKMTVSLSRDGQLVYRLILHKEQAMEMAQNIAEIIKEIS